MPTFLVLGSPRTGTSMVAGLLHDLGVTMGYDLLPADRWNQLGYFEDTTFLALHRVLGFAATEPRRRKFGVPSDLPNPDDALRRRYARLCQSRGARNAVWGMKDPRTLFLFDLTIEATAGQDVRCLFTRRRFESVVESLCAMFEWPKRDAREVADLYRRKQRLVEDRWEGPRLVIDYEEALAQPAELVEQVARFVDCDVTVDAKRRIDPRLKRC